MITYVNKWWHCFIEWEDTDGKRKLSVIPWHVFLINAILKYITGNDKFKWAWVPPWKIEVTKN